MLFLVICDFKTALIWIIFYY